MLLMPKFPHWLVMQKCIKEAKNVLLKTSYDKAKVSSCLDYGSYMVCEWIMALLININKLGKIYYVCVCVNPWLFRLCDSSKKTRRSINLLSLTMSTESKIKQM